MAIQNALLRAVNVGGRSVPMADLRACAAELGLKDVRSILQSGNLVFESPELAGGALEAALEAAVQARFGLAADVIVRSAAEWTALIAANPFPEAARDDPSHLVVMPMKTAPAKAGVEAVTAAIVGREMAQAHGHELYIVYPDGIGTSKLTNALIERKAGVRGTARNWNTVLKIGAAAQGGRAT
jgi:uncharacterized protein (DUF1697 family)